MRVKKLKIENFRGIRNLDLSFEGSEMVVFAGVNGAGKTTVLVAMQYLFSWYVARLKNQKGKGLQLDESDITNGQPYCFIEIEIEEHDHTVRWSLFKKRSSYRKPVDRLASRAELNDFVDSKMEIFADGKEHNLPLVDFYSVNRVVDAVPLRVRKKHELGPLDAFDSGLSNSVNFHSFFLWFREREDLENELYRELGKKFHGDMQLVAVRSAIRNLLPGYEKFRVKRDPLSFVVEKKGETFSFGQLSDGEKSYIALVCDIARKMAMANPRSDFPLERSAIVMIDEIELHLHPEWQMGVVDHLKKTFPRVQFFLTTHSPHIVTNLRNSGCDTLVALDRGEAVPTTQNQYGQTVDFILNDVFQLKSLRNGDVQKKIDEIWNLLKKGDCTSVKYRKLLLWLRENISPADPEFVRIALQEKRIEKGLV